MNNLQDLYKTQIFFRLQKEFNYKNIHEIPKLQKIVISSSYGLKALNTNFLKAATQEYRLISGQQPALTKVKKSISGFKIRQNMPIGLVVTLRKRKMYDFLERLIKLVLPRIRDFRGLSPFSIDILGNYTIGIRDQSVFPEVQMDSKDVERGFNITFVTTSKTRKETFYLLKCFGLPFNRSI
jgi:large subunit ribosomal protein L5